MGEAVGVGRDAGRGAVSLIVHKPGRPVCQTRPLCTTQAPPRVVGCHGTFSTASLFNIIICVIQHLPFIYFYLFFSLGNLGSSPGRLQKSLSTCSSSGPPPLSPILGAAVLMGWPQGPGRPPRPSTRTPLSRHRNSSNLIKQKLVFLIVSWGSFTKQALWPGSCWEGWIRQESSKPGRLPGLRSWSAHLLSYGVQLSDF